MSHFVFGFVQLTDDLPAPARAALADVTIRRYAARVGIAIAIDNESEQPLVSEMRGSCSEAAAIPFLCVAQSGDDTSDGLISPYLLGTEEACAGARAIAAWAGLVSRDACVSKVVVWFTEGFDNAFESHDCTADRAAELLVARIRDNHYVPSVVLNIGRGTTTPTPTIGT